MPESVLRKNPASRITPLTDMKLHPEIFSQGVLHAAQTSPLVFDGVSKVSTYLGSTSSLPVGPDAPSPKCHHMNVPAHQG